jgi:AcrR family transcriptional regulator
MGLRELKKAKTRKMISDLATQLFFERGYGNVTTAEIADMAEVSAKTLFNYFPTKEALVFDEDQESESTLIKIIENRKKAQPILEALLEGLSSKIDIIHKNEKKGVKYFRMLIEKTPELKLYEQQMWLRHEKALATAIRKEAKTKPGQLEVEAIARFILDSFWRVLGTSNPKLSLRKLFILIEKGWLE